jgi:hypothetical protein
MTAALIEYPIVLTHCWECGTELDMECPKCAEEWNR